MTAPVPTPPPARPAAPALEYTWDVWLRDTDGPLAVTAAYPQVRFGVLELKTRDGEIVFVVPLAALAYVERQDRPAVAADC